MPYIEDFSLLTGEIALVQHGRMTRPYVYRAYAQGRRSFGLVLAVAGACEYRLISGESVTLSAGDVAFLPAQARYLVSGVGEAAFDHYTVNFSLLSAGGALSNLPESTEVLVVHLQNAAGWSERFAALLGEWSGKRPGYALRCQAILYDLLADFFAQRMSSGVDQITYERTLPALRWMESHYDQEISLDALARLCAMSPTHFRRLFRSVYNTSPIDYLLSLRIRKACDLLLSHNWTVGEVALKTGFQFESYFCRYFKRQIGCSPRIFMKTGPVG